MKHEQQLVIKRWIPITRAKVKPRAFKSVKLLCAAHHVSPKELRRYYTRWIESKKDPLSVLPEKRGPKPGSRRTPKEIERNIMKAYRQFGSNRYELILLFKPYYLDKTPSPATATAGAVCLQTYASKVSLLRIHGISIRVPDAPAACPKATAPPIICSDKLF